MLIVDVLVLDMFVFDLSVDYEIIKIEWDIFKWENVVF